MKILFKEKDIALRQEARIVLPAGYYMTSDNQLKILDPAAQPFDPLKRVRKKIKHEKKTQRRKSQKVKMLKLKKNGLRHNRKNSSLG